MTAKDHRLVELSADGGVRAGGAVIYFVMSYPLVAGRALHGMSAGASRLRPQESLA